MVRSGNAALNQWPTKPAPQTRLGLATEDLVHLDRSLVASALRVPEGIDDLHRRARGGVRMTCTVVRAEASDVWGKTADDMQREHPWATAL